MPNEVVIYLPCDVEQAALDGVLREFGLSVLDKQCLPCHSGQLRKGGLDLSSREALLRGGDSGAAITAGNARESLLYKLVAHERQPAMPYKAAKLPDEVIARLTGGQLDLFGAPSFTSRKRYGQE